MLTPEDIQARLREKPFRPFRIIVSEGLRYEIRHPDLVFVGRRDIQIGFTNVEGSAIYDRVTRVAIIHIVALEELESPAPADEAQA
jgi:hypothetical protein